MKNTNKLSYVTVMVYELFGRKKVERFSMSVHSTIVDNFMGIITKQYHGNNYDIVTKRI